MTAIYNPWLVVASICIAIIASYTALDLASHVSSAAPRAVKYWIGGGALAMGLGIWAMHFVGMLAFSLPIPLTYDIPITLGSMVPAIAGAALALYLIRRGVESAGGLVAGAVVIGLGISAMHYSGMAALKMSPPIDYDPLRVALSVAVAVAASGAALWLGREFGARDRAQSIIPRKIGSATLMGFAIVSMHYLGMEAADFAPGSVCLASPSAIEATWLAVLVGGGTVFLGALTVVTSIFDVRLAEQHAGMVAQLSAMNRRLELRAAELAEQMTQELRLSAKVFEASNDGILIADHSGCIVAVNRAYREITGYAPDEVIGQAPPALTFARRRKRLFRKVWSSLETTGRWEGQVRDRRKNGEVYVQRLSVAAVKDGEGQVTHYVGVLADVTERVEAERKLRHMASHDELTGLPNRALFHEHLRSAIAQARKSARMVAILVVDLDNFKLVNDTLGHHYGDLLLRQVARRLELCVGEADMVARQGGDEFAVILESIANPVDAAAVASRVLDALAPKFEVGGHEFFITASVGINVYPLDDSDVHDLLKNADAAMYLAKERGRNSYCFFTREVHQRARERFLLEGSLRRAIEHGEFELHYQPQVVLATGRIVGVEALVRWRDAERGLVEPLEFIPAAEANGLILAIGEWVLREACRQCKAWEEVWRAAGASPFTMAVNISARQFAQPDLVERIEAVLAETGLDPRRLELELTESMLMKNVQETATTLERLHALGVALAIDDFGTGHSSLDYLRRFPVGKLKIDKSFVQDVGDDAHDEAIVKAIVGLAHNLELKVVAEGVETLSQRAFLAACGCNEAQGYHFALPQPAAEVGELLRCFLPLARQ